MELWAFVSYKVASPFYASYSQYSGVSFNEESWAVPETGLTAGQVLVYETTTLIDGNTYYVFHELLAGSRYKYYALAQDQLSNMEQY